MKEYITILKDDMFIINILNRTNYACIEFYEKNSPYYYTLYSRVLKNQPSNKARILWGSIRDERKGSWIQLKDSYVVSLEQPMWYK